MKKKCSHRSSQHCFLISDPDPGPDPAPAPDPGSGPDPASGPDPDLAPASAPDPAPDLAPDPAPIEPKLAKEVLRTKQRVPETGFGLAHLLT